MGCHKWPQSRWLPDSSKSEKWQSKAAKSRRPSDSSVDGTCLPIHARQELDDKASYIIFNFHSLFLVYSIVKSFTSKDIYF